MRRGWGVLVLALAPLASCRNSAAYVAKPGPYDQISSEALQDARVARAAWEEGNLRRAQRLLGTRVQENPRHVSLGILLQEVELFLLQRGQSVEGRYDPSGPLSAEEARGRLEGSYLGVAQSAQDPVPWLLAARLAGDAAARDTRLAVALELDPDCVWNHYTQAWAAHGRRDFPGAREAIARALAIDPGHAPSRRLEANLLSNAGETRLAIRILSVWLGHASEDPFVSARALREARIDLASLQVSDGRAEQALELLDSVDFPEREVRARAELVRAAAYEERGDLDLALSSARLAASFAPDDLLPLVHEAILAAQESELFPDERTAWERVLTAAQEQAELAEREASLDTEAPADFLNMWIQLQARTYLERLRSQPEP